LILISALNYIVWGTSWSRSHVLVSCAIGVGFETDWIQY